MENKKLDQEKEIQAIISNNTDIVERATNMVVTNATEQHSAMDVLADCKKFSKQVDSIRKKLVDPYNAWVKQINTRAKEIAKPFTDSKEIIEGKLNDYFLKQQAEKRRKEALNQKRIERAIENDKPAPVTVAPVVEKTIKSEKSTTSMTTEFKGEVIDKQKFIVEYVIPNNMFHLLDINNKELNNLVKMIKDSKKIAGLNIFERPKITTRSKS